MPICFIHALAGMAGDILSPGTTEELADMIVSFVLESDSRFAV
jgi:hypothetical protein